MTELEAFDHAKTLLTAKGWTVSPGSWHEHEQVFVFSSEGCGPGSYGAAAASVNGLLQDDGSWSFFEPTRDRSSLPADWKW